VGVADLLALVALGLPEQPASATAALTTRATGSRRRRTKEPRVIGEWVIGGEFWIPTVARPSQMRRTGA